MESETGSRRALTWFSFLNQLSYSQRYDICNILNVGAKWKVLAGELGYELIAIENLALNPRPSEDLLSDWSHRQPTLDTFYKKLKKLQFMYAADVLKGYVVGEDAQRSDSVPESDDNSSHYKPVTELPVPSLSSLPGEDTDVKESLSPDSHHGYSTRRSQFPPTVHQPPHAVADSGDHYGYLQTQQPPPPPKVCVNNRMPSPLTRVPPLQRFPVFQFSHPTSTVPPHPMASYAPDNFGGHVMSDSQNEFASVPRLPGGGQFVPQGTRPVSGLSSAEKTFDKSLHLNLQSIGLDKASCLPEVNHRYHYDDLKKATYGFANDLIIEQDAIATVYRGVLRNTIAAIKRITTKSRRDAKLNMKMLSSEVENLLNIRHSNLVAVYGYNADGDDFYLISELVELGSLQTLLARKDNVLQHSQRLDILRGAAEGLRYLHSHTPTPVVHGSLKSCNILVDANFDAKLSDFGLAKFVAEFTEGVNGSHVNHLLSREHCDLSEAYLPPENEASLEADVFSFGVVIFECCTGEKPVDERREGGRHLKTHIDNSCVMNAGSYRSENRTKCEQYQQLCDPFLKSLWDPKQWDVLLVLGMRCTAGSKGDRPQISEVLEQLNNLQQESDTLAAPQNHQNMLNGPVLGSEAVCMTAPNVQFFSFNPSLQLPPRYPISCRNPIQSFAPLQQPFIDPRLQMQYRYEGGSHHLNPEHQMLGYHPAPLTSLQYRAPFVNPFEHGMPYQQPGHSIGIPYQQQGVSFGNHLGTIAGKTCHFYENDSASKAPTANMNKMQFDRQQKLVNVGSCDRPPAYSENMKGNPNPSQPGSPKPNKTVQNPSSSKPSTGGTHSHLSSSVKHQDTSNKSQNLQNSARIHNVCLAGPTEISDTALYDLPIEDLNLNLHNSVDNQIKMGPCRKESKDDCKNVKLQLDLKLEEEEKVNIDTAKEDEQNQHCGSTDDIEHFPKTQHGSSQDVCHSVDPVVPVMEKSFPSFVRYNSFNSSSSEQSSDDADEFDDLTTNTMDMTPYDTEGILEKKWPSFMHMDSTEDGDSMMVPRGFGLRSINKSASLDFKVIKNCDKYRFEKQKNGRKNTFGLLDIYNNLKFEDKCLSDPCLRSNFYVPRKCTLSGPQTCSLPTDSPAIYT